MTYVLTLSSDDVETIAFVGHRYAWSEALLSLEPGDNSLTEPEAWSIKNAFERDTEGGHAPFPMLAAESDLAKRLHDFWNAIV